MAIPRLAWVEIDSSALKHNLSLVQKQLKPNTKMMAVVKANAYGHGAVGVARVAQDFGVEMFGVSSFYEAKELRQNGITLPILILGYTPAENYQDMIDFDITATIKNLDVAKALVTAARRADKITKVWVKVDTGMHRLGLEPDQVLFFCKKLQDLPNLEIEGIFTHFAEASDTQFSKLQFERFQKVVEELENEGVQIPVKSVAASGAIFRYPQMHLDMVRVGLAMHGLNPEKGNIFSKELKPTLSFKTEVVQVHELQLGETVGYGRTFKVTRPSRIATLAVGYGDGFRRAPFNYGEVLIRGQRAPLAGRVSMDQAAADITDIHEDIRAGEEVVLIGKQGKQELKAEDVAEKLQTTSYEVVTSLTQRVTRIFTK